MELIFGFQAMQQLNLKDSVLTQGTFDGVHLGHRRILETVVSEAKKIAGNSVLLTFHPHPRQHLFPNEQAPKILTTLAEKCKEVEKLGIDFMVVLPFNEYVANLSALDFVEQILIQHLKVKKMIIGYDHHFGKNRGGNLQFLLNVSRNYHFSVEEIPANEIDDIAISSSRIRKALLNGQVELAASLLGRNYGLEGIVVHGQKLGRQLGFPTANLRIPEEEKLIPKTGVYAMLCCVGVEKYFAVGNIGYNPTIEGKGFSIESHLFGFQDNLYDIAVRFELVARIRDEQKFNNVEELKEKIQQDCEKAKEIFAIV